MSKLINYAWCRMRGQHWSGFLAIGNDQIVRHLVSDITHQRRFYAKGKDCCPETPHTKGRTIEPWPKPFDPDHSPWSPECPTGPPPPNNDLYRIKVPEVIVPPLPASSAKWDGILLAGDQSNQGGYKGNYGGGYGYQNPHQSQQPRFDQMGNPIPQEEKDESFLEMLKGFFGKGKKKHLKINISTWSPCPTKYTPPGMSNGSPLFRSPEIPGRVQDLFHNSAIVHPDYWKEKPEKRDLDVGSWAGNARLGYHGHVKYQFAFHEPWKPIDRLALMAEAEQESINPLEKDIVDPYKDAQ